jgi:hypothetical protein
VRAIPTSTLSSDGARPGGQRSSSSSRGRGARAAPVARRQRSSASSASAAAASPPAGRGAARVVRVVRARVPAARGDVEASGEGLRPVDRDHLLVVAGEPGMGRVDTEHQPGRRAQAVAQRRDQVAHEGPQRGVAPAEHVHLELRPAPDLLAQQRQQVGRAPRAPPAPQPHPPVEVPAEQDHASPRTLQRACESAEEGLAVHQERDAPGVGHAPAGLARAQQRPGHRRCRLGKLHPGLLPAGFFQVACQRWRPRGSHLRGAAVV